MTPAFIIVLLVLAAMWALLAVPRQREARRHQEVVASLAAGDNVMTGGGIFGTVVVVEDDYVLVEVATGTVIKVARQAVAITIDREVPQNSPYDPAVDVHASDRLED
ncbi:MAG: preprotein translocase subunit YajC [Actinomycetes bacterium]